MRRSPRLHIRRGQQFARLPADSRAPKLAAARRCQDDWGQQVAFGKRAAARLAFQRAARGDGTQFGRDCRSG